jgi:CPA1 family monovalent cation:H+ antiporter
MSVFQMAALVIVLAAVFSYVNHKFLRLPTAIGLTALTLAASLAVVLAGMVVPAVDHQARAAVEAIDLNQALVHGMLGFMLFAGSMHMDLHELASRKWAVALLATAGVVISTLVVGFFTWGLLAAVGIPARLIYCLVFGALISPTDPIAVMAILRQAGVPKGMEVKIAGESLFNDGAALVAFFGFLEIATGTHEFDLAHLAGLFAREALGGAALGFAAGWVVYRLLRSVDDYQVEVLLSLALAAGGYALAAALHTSGPVAMVVAGLLIGSLGRTYAMSPIVLEHVDTFWELVDEILNAVVFVLIGLEVLVMHFSGPYVLAGLSAIPVVLFARLVAVAGPITLLRRRGGFTKYTIRILTWGGLRGGISVALALSLPKAVGDQPVPERNVIVTLTYIVVVFSILIQGMTVGPLARYWLGKRAVPAAPAGA